MKKVILILLSIFLLSNLLLGQKKQWRSSIKSGYIEYKLTGNTTGVRYMWWDDFGKKIRVEEKSVSVVKMMGVKNEEKNNYITIMKEGVFWSADMTTHSGQKGKLPDYEEFVKFYEGMTKDEVKDLERQLLSSFGGEKIGKGIVLGKECDIISLMGSKVWLYKGMSLKSEVDVMGIKNKEQAVSFKINIPIPNSKFKPKEGIKYTDISEVMKKSMDGISIEF